MGLILAVANQKGGVGKTATSVNLGAALALDGFRVLVIDLDSQGSATSGLGEERTKGESSYEVLSGDIAADQAIHPTSIPNLFLIPGTRDLAGAEVELVTLPDRHSRLRTQLEPVRSGYDYILIDCPPSLGMLTLNALCAADAVVVPLQCEFYALEGLGALVETLERVRATFHPDLRILGILLTMYDGRTSLSRQVAREVRQHFGPKVLQAMVPRNVRISESPSYGQPVVTYDPGSQGATAYRNAAREIAEMTKPVVAPASASGEFPSAAPPVESVASGGESAGEGSAETAGTETASETEPSELRPSETGPTEPSPTERMEAPPIEARPTEDRLTEPAPTGTAATQTGPSATGTAPLGSEYGAETGAENQAETRPSEPGPEPSASPHNWNDPENFE